MGAILSCLAPEPKYILQHHEDPKRKRLIEKTRSHNIDLRAISGDRSSTSRSKSKKSSIIKDEQEKTEKELDLWSRYDLIRPHIDGVNLQQPRRDPIQEDPKYAAYALAYNLQYDRFGVDPQNLFDQPIPECYIKKIPNPRTTQTKDDLEFEEMTKTPNFFAPRKSIIDICDISDPTVLIEKLQDVMEEHKKEEETAALKNALLLENFDTADLEEIEEELDEGNLEQELKEIAKNDVDATVFNAASKFRSLIGGAKKDGYDNADDNNMMRKRRNSLLTADLDDNKNNNGPIDLSGRTSPGLNNENKPLLDKSDFLEILKRKRKSKIEEQNMMREFNKLLNPDDPNNRSIVVSPQSSIKEGSMNNGWNLTKDEDANADITKDSSKKAAIRKKEGRSSLLSNGGTNSVENASEIEVYERVANLVSKETELDHVLSNYYVNLDKTELDKPSQLSKRDWNQNTGWQPGSPKNQRRNSKINDRMAGVLTKKLGIIRAEKEKQIKIEDKKTENATVSKMARTWMNKLKNKKEVSNREKLETQLAQRRMTFHSVSDQRPIMNQTAIAPMPITINNIPNESPKKPFRKQLTNFNTTTPRQEIPVFTKITEKSISKTSAIDENSDNHSPKSRDQKSEFEEVYDLATKTRKIVVEPKIDTDKEPKLPDKPKPEKTSVIINQNLQRPQLEITRPTISSVENLKTSLEFTKSMFDSKFDSAIEDIEVAETKTPKAKLVHVATQTKNIDSSDVDDQWVHPRFRKVPKSPKIGQETTFPAKIAETIIKNQNHNQETTSSPQKIKKLKKRRKKVPNSKNSLVADREKDEEKISKSKNSEATLRTRVDSGRRSSFLDFLPPRPLTAPINEKINDSEVFRLFDDHDVSGDKSPYENHSKHHCQDNESTNKILSSSSKAGSINLSLMDLKEQIQVPSDVPSVIGF